ncbi:hypothetical protein JX265_005410 [Neoarthrinium moseri]|uniref:DJ-1/PfpI domain-containing protein n=1 Tax=Neoarthrinium moseri TaxID=1658444 RepID=A0A9P9WNP2_9PEZI|nr:hypothetical protein JX265_005410 [Neoarthrinium moseri]
MASPRKTVRIGVFIPKDCQLLDAACVDILASMSHEYLSIASDMIPRQVVDLAPSVRIHYVGSVKAGEPIPMTANLRAQATNHFGDDEVAPGNLDIVVVPGPDPAARFEEDALDWLRRHSEQPATDILSVCTGIYVCGYAGLLKGKTICGPRGVQDDITARFGKDIIQKGAELRWVQDGNFWSSGGVTNGNDLAAAYARQKSEFWPRPVVETVIALTDVGDRGQAYGKSPSMADLASTL